MDTKDRKQSFFDWMKENESILVAILLLTMCFGIMDKVVSVINNTLLRITDFERNTWLDCLFLIVTIWLGIRCWVYWIKLRKVVTPRSVSLILFPLILYLFFRFAKSSPYRFVSYWNWEINYLDGFAFVGIVIIVLFVWQRFKTSGEHKVNAKYEFDSDAPIKGSDKDLFNMGGLVDRIVNYIAFTDVHEAAFSMGLVGEWGDGKTSLMNLVEGAIHKNHKDFIIVHFNPRASKKADFIQEDFLESLKSSLAQLHSGIERTIDKYAVALDAIPGIPPLVSKGLELLNLQSDKERDLKRDDLKKAIIDIDRRIVVLVDDLDRLTGEELIEVMKVLDTNGAFPNMVFLTSFDKNYVNTVLHNYLKLGNQKRNYTDKYFTVEIRIPLHPSFRLLNYLVKILKGACEKGFIEKDVDQIEEETRKQAPYIFKRLHTIRDIKRFANQFLYDYAEIQRDVHFRDYFLLELIKFAHPDEYKAIHELKFIHRGQTSFLSPSSDDLLYLSEDLFPKKNRAGDIIKEPFFKPESIDILIELFPEEANYRNWYAGRYSRVYCVSSFEHYFYNYEYSHLKADDIEQLYCAETIKEACMLIDQWGGFTKDLETYLLTRDITSITSKRVLRRFMQVLLYAAHNHQAINYLGQNYSFIRKEDVEKITKNCGFATEGEYKTWFKESMAELTEINPIIPANYLRIPISTMFSQDSYSDLFIFTLQELQDYALELLKDYLKQVEAEGWDSDTAFYMSQIQGDANGTFLPAACSAIHDSMVSHFGRFSASLPLIVEDYLGVHIGFTTKINFNAVFTDKDEFGQIINDEANKEAPEIEMIRIIWPLFKANDCNTVTLPKEVSLADAKQKSFKEALKDLDKYEDIDKRLHSMAEQWKRNHKLKNADSFIDRANTILADLKAIPLKLNKGERYENEIYDLINQFQDYCKTARILNKETLRIGDIVRTKEDVYEKYLSQHLDDAVYNENLFTVSTISDTGQIMTKESIIPFSYDDLEAVLIDGVEDAEVYYRPKNTMATYVDYEEPAPVHEADFSYYMVRFKSCYDSNKKSYYDWVIELGFQFVHEVQHWLKDKMNDEGLEVNHLPSSNSDVDV